MTGRGDHHDDDKAKRQRNADVAQLPGHGVDDDGPTARHDQRKGTEQFGEGTAQQVRLIQGRTPYFISN